MRGERVLAWGVEGADSSLPPSPSLTLVPRGRPPLLLEPGVPDGLHGVLVHGRQVGGAVVGRLAGAAAQNGDQRAARVRGERHQLQHARVRVNGEDGGGRAAGRGDVALGGSGNAKRRVGSGTHAGGSARAPGRRRHASHPSHSSRFPTCWSIMGKSSRSARAAARHPPPRPAPAARRWPRPRLPPRSRYGVHGARAGGRRPRERQARRRRRAMAAPAAARGRGAPAGPAPTPGQGRACVGAVERGGEGAGGRSGGLGVGRCWLRHAPSRTFDGATARLHAARAAARRASGARRAPARERHSPWWK